MTERLLMTGRPPAPARRWAAAGTVCLGLFLLGMDLTVLNVAVPDLERRLHPTTAQVQWIVDGYALVLGGLVLATGGVTDRIGRRLAYVTGTTVCAAASALGACAGTPGQVIAARAGMGAGAALLMPATLSILTNLFPEPALRRRAIALWTAVAGLGILTGPVVGGALVEQHTWRAGFWINLPVALPAVVLALLLVPESRAPRTDRIDVAGTLLSAAALTTLVWAIIEAPTLGWTGPWVLAAFGVAAVLLGAFVLWEHRGPAPLLPLSLLRDRRIGGGTTALALMAFSLFGSLFVQTLYLQGVLGFTPWQAGLRTLPQAVAMSAGAMVAPALLSRYAEKLPVVLGLLAIAAAFAYLTGTTTDSTYSRLAVVQFVAGFGAGLAATAGTESVMSAITPQRAALGSAINDATRQVGAALGVAVQGSLLATVYTDRLTARLGALASVPGAHRPGAAGLPGAFDPGGDTLPPTARTALADAARRSFVDGMTTTAAVVAAVVLVTAAAAAWWLPGRRRQRRPTSRAR
ncbi:MFS transporter [Streptomyces luteireticuli]